MGMARSSTLAGHHVELAAGFGIGTRSLGGSHERSDVTVPSRVNCLA
jgi:hypothetical protein